MEEPERPESSIDDELPVHINNPASNEAEQANGQQDPQQFDAVVPVIYPGQPENTMMEPPSQEASEASFELTDFEKNMARDFIKKVCIVVLIQVWMTMLLISILVFSPEVAEEVIAKPIWIAPFFAYSGVVVVLVRCKCIKHWFLHYWVGVCFSASFHISVSLVLMWITAWLPNPAVVFIVMLLVFIPVILMASMQFIAHKVHWILVWIASLVILLSVFLPYIFVFSEEEDDKLSGILAIVFVPFVNLLLCFDINRIAKVTDENRKDKFDIDQYLVASIYLYSDIMLVFGLVLTYLLYKARSHLPCGGLCTYCDLMGCCKWKLKTDHLTNNN